jgi:hypothetical protein
MTQEKHDFTVLSDKVCTESGCAKRLKLNVVERKEPHNACRCYKCGQVTVILIKAVQKANADAARNRS